MDSKHFGLKSLLALSSLFFLFSCSPEASSASLGELGSISDRWFNGRIVKKDSGYHWIKYNFEGETLEAPVYEATIILNETSYTFETKGYDEALVALEGKDVYAKWVSSLYPAKDHPTFTDTTVMVSKIKA